MRCLVCQKELKDIGVDNQPVGGLSFMSYGHYGTAVFDPMDGSFLEINVCDECIKRAGEAGNVLLGFPQPQTRGPMVQWPLQRAPTHENN